MPGRQLPATATCPSQWWQPDDVQKPTGGGQGEARSPSAPGRHGCDRATWPQCLLRPGFVPRAPRHARFRGCWQCSTGTEVRARPAWLGCSPMPPGSGATGYSRRRGLCLAAGSRSGSAGASSLRRNQSPRMHLSKAVGGGRPAGIWPEILSPLLGPSGPMGSGRGSLAGSWQDTRLPPLQLPLRSAPISPRSQPAGTRVGGSGNTTMTARCQR